MLRLISFTKGYIVTPAVDWVWYVCGAHVKVTDEEVSNRLKLSNKSPHEYLIISEKVHLIWPECTWAWFELKALAK